MAMERTRRSRRTSELDTVAARSTRPFLPSALAVRACPPHLRSALPGAIVRRACRARAARRAPRDPCHGNAGWFTEPWGGPLNHGLGGPLNHALGGPLNHALGGPLDHGVGGPLNHRVGHWTP